MTGYTEDEIKTMEDWYKKAYPDPESREKAKKHFKYDIENKEHNRLIYVAVDDITENKKRELELKEVKERLELAVEGGNIGIWDWNAANDSVHFNENWAQMLGYELSELENNLDTWLDLVHPDDKEQQKK